jgi:aspartyl-tRNA synthetase
MVQHGLRQGGRTLLTRCAAPSRPIVRASSLPTAQPGLPRRGGPLRRLAAAAAAAAPPPRPRAPSAAAEALELDVAGGPSVVEPGLTWPSRSHACGALTEADVGCEVRVCGWVDRARNLGGILFLDIRDHTGIVQVVVDPQAQPEVAAAAERLRSEWVVAVTGALRRRQDPNPRLPTGAVEVAAGGVRVLNAVTRALPFPVGEGEPPREELRLRHRVLDLRRPAMAANLRLRHALVRCVRRHLEDVEGFIEVETPVLTRSTPEGARDYLVPSRLQAGEWYALPQSPQLFKQMLMVAGYDRYYQVRGRAAAERGAAAMRRAS